MLKRKPEIFEAFRRGARTSKVRCEQKWASVQQTMVVSDDDDDNGCADTDIDSSSEDCGLNECLEGVGQIQHSQHQLSSLEDQRSTASSPTRDHEMVPGKSQAEPNNNFAQTIGQQSDGSAAHAGPDERATDPNDVEKQPAAIKCGNLSTLLDSFAFPASSTEEVTFSDYRPLYAATPQKKKATNYKLMSIPKPDGRGRPKKCEEVIVSNYQPLCAQAREEDQPDTGIIDKIEKRGRPGKFQKLVEDFEALSPEKKKHIVDKWASMADESASWEARKFQLLVAAVIHAKTTETTVRSAMAGLRAAPCGCTPEGLAGTSEQQLVDLLSSVHWHREKAKRLRRCGESIREMAGIVPSKQQELQKLPGIGEKLARVLAFVFDELAASASSDA